MTTINQYEYLVKGAGYSALILYTMDGSRLDKLANMGVADKYMRDNSLIRPEESLELKAQVYGEKQDTFSFAKMGTIASRFNGSLISIGDEYAIKTRNPTLVERLKKL